MREYDVPMAVGEDDCIVTVAAGTKELPGAPYAGTRDMELISIITQPDGRDITTEGEALLDWGVIAEWVNEVERDEREREWARDDVEWSYR